MTHGNCTILLEEAQIEAEIHHVLLPDLLTQLLA